MMGDVLHSINSSYLSSALLFSVNSYENVSYWYAEVSSQRLVRAEVKN